MSGGGGGVSGETATIDAVGWEGEGEGALIDWMDAAAGTVLGRGSTGAVRRPGLSDTHAARADCSCNDFDEAAEEMLRNALSHIQGIGSLFFGHP